jgi:hypothetical protein
MKDLNRIQVEWKFYFVSVVCKQIEDMSFLQKYKTNSYLKLMWTNWILYEKVCWHNNISYT